MKKTLLLSIMLFIAVFILSSCAGADNAVFDIEQRVQSDTSDLTGSTEVLGERNDVVEQQPSESFSIVTIGERLFINQMFEVFLNHQQYLGSIIQYEGIFREISWGGDQYIFIVYRNMLGCCGEEEKIGFEVLMEDFEPFSDDTWVDVAGVLEIYNGFLALRVVSITELNERGLEFVS